LVFEATFFAGELFIRAQNDSVAALEPNSNGHGFCPLNRRVVAHPYFSQVNNLPISNRRSVD